MSIINYENSLAAEAAANEKKERDQADADGWGKVLSRWALKDSTANFKILQEWCKPNPITVEAVAVLLRDKPDSVDMSSREGIIKDIITHSHGDADALRNLRVRLSTYSLGQLRQKRRDISFKAEVNSHDAAKKFVASQRDTEIGWRGTGYPKLQSTIVPPGHVQAIQTGQYLRQLIKTDYFLFKRMVKLYSSQQCDWWMNNGQ